MKPSSAGPHPVLAADLSSTLLRLAGVRELTLELEAAEFFGLRIPAH